MKLVLYIKIVSYKVKCQTSLSLTIYMIECSCSTGCH